MESGEESGAATDVVPPTGLDHTSDTFNDNTPNALDAPVTSSPAIDSSRLVAVNVLKHDIGDKARKAGT
jgi:hypothetical protein